MNPPNTPRETDAPASRAFAPAPYADDEIDLRDLIATLWQGKWWIMLCTVLATLAAGTVAVMTTPQFKSESVLQLRDEKSGGGLSSQLGGLAALAGVSIGASSSNQAFADAYVRSRSFVQGFIEEQNLLPALYPDRWDAEQGTWRKQTRRFSDEPLAPPTAWHAYNDFTKDVFSISVDAKTGTQTWSVSWHDPEVAAEWLQLLITRANTQLSKAAREEASNNLSYLEEQLRAAATVEVRQTVASMMESEMNKLMMTSNAERGTLIVVDPPQVSQAPYKPRKSLMVALGFVLGGMLGVMTVLLRKAFSRADD